MTCSVRLRARCRPTFTERKLGPRFRQHFMSCPVDTASRASTSRSGRGGTAPARAGPGLRVSRFVRGRTRMRQIRTIGVSSTKRSTGILSGPAISRSMSSNDDSFESPVSLEPVLAAPSSARNPCTFEAGRPVQSSTCLRGARRPRRCVPAHGMTGSCQTGANLALGCMTITSRGWSAGQGVRVFESVSGLGGYARPAFSDTLPGARLSRRKPGKGMSPRVRRSRTVTWNAKTVVCGLTACEGNRNLEVSLLSVSGTSRPSA